MHVDVSEDEEVLIYPYYQHTLLGLLKEDSNISDAARKKFLRQTGEAIQELHSKDWIHIGTITSPNLICTHEIATYNQSWQISSPIIYWSTGLATKRVPKQSPTSL
jgi:tRNA A-37 threonylcarbamoyl transferase component Bud32